MKKSWRIWLGVVITLVFLGIAFRGQDFNAIRQALRDFNYHLSDSRAGVALHRHLVPGSALAHFAQTRR